MACVRGSAPLRRALAAIAARLVAMRAWERLGYARLADYARERPGLSPRTLQDLAHIDGALRGLPEIEGALLAGALSWTKVRLLCRVATPADERHWVAYARGVTARALAREVRAVDAGAVEAGALDGDDGESVDETACILVRCSPRVQGLFHRARWLARRAAGEHLPSWACMEAVAAEGLSALADGAQAALEEADLDTAPANPWAASPRSSASLGGLAGEPFAPAATRADRGAAPAGVAAVGAAVAHRSFPDEPSQTLRALLAGLPEADAFELDERLRRAIGLEQRLDARLAPLVRAVSETGRHRALGFASLEAWGRERLGASPRKLRALLRLARAAERWPPLYDDFREGRLSWVRAHAVLPALALARSRAEARSWLERAASLSVRRLEEEVDAAELAPPAPEQERQTGARPRGGGEGVDTCADPPAPSPPPPPREDARFLFFGPASVAHVFRAVLCSARRRLERATGRAASEGEAAGWLFEHSIETWLASAGSDPRLARAHRVFARDGWRCTVPGCTSYRNLHDHHVRFRSAGGSDDLANRTTLCAFHHLRGVHAGRVRITGMAPDGLRFELGLRRGRPPLVCYGANERIVS